MSHTKNQISHNIIGCWSSQMTHLHPISYPSRSMWLIYLSFTLKINWMYAKHTSPMDPMGMNSLYSKGLWPDLPHFHTLYSTYIIIYIYIAHIPYELVGIYLYLCIFTIKKHSFLNRSPPGRFVPLLPACPPAFLLLAFCQTYTSICTCFAKSAPAMKCYTSEN